MPRAIIDLGTNTFNLLVFDPDRSSAGQIGLKIIHQEEIPVFLGKDGLERGVIGREAFDRGLAALDRIMLIVRSQGLSEAKGFGCSTFRNAANAKDLIRAAAERGIRIEVVAGSEEAAIILEGVRLAVPFTSKPALVMDIGGGSIEFILATNKALMWKQSFEIGVTRIRERIPIGEPIGVDEEMRIAEFFDAQLEPLWQIIDRHEPHLLIGSAGSFESIATMLGATVNGPIQSDQRSYSFTTDRFDDLKDRLFRLSREERSNFPGLPAHRIDTMIYAMVAIDRVVVASGIREMAWSRYSLKEGAAIRELRNG